MLIVVGALSTPLAAQDAPPAAPAAPDATAPSRGAIGVGFAATLGSGWQIESGEIGYVRRLGGGFVRALSGSLRIGAFVDEGAILGGSRGIVAAGTVAARTGQMRLAEMGDQQALTSIGFDVTFEATGYLGSHSPMPQGSAWAAAALLPGLRVGSGIGPQYSLAVGPTVFFGSKTEVRGLLAFRVEAPLARRERHP
jgi:hypothetical protein